jgi:6-pyruvoyltetrahydropterin/6-carboxytetrahydropterin synthase
MHIAVYDSFPAAHRIRIDDAGTREPVHVHHWRVRIRFRADSADMESAARARTWLAAWVARHRGRSLNDVPPFDDVNPTAEEVAREIAGLFAGEFPTWTLDSVTVGEAAGFSATFTPGAVTARQ